MAEAGISSPQATTPKGLRHGFAIAMLEADSPVPFHILRDFLGNSPTKTTEIYDRAVGVEKRRMVLNAWGQIIFFKKHMLYTLAIYSLMP